MRRGLVAIGFLAVACLLGGCAGKDEVEEELVRPVRWARVFATGGARERTFSGMAQAGVESQLSFKVAGTVRSMAVTVGELVERGGLIATLDDSDYRLRVQEAEASLAQAQAQLRNARNGHERAVQLYENGSASKQDLDAARAAFESATAQVAAIEKRLDLARLQVAYTRLEAPFAGAVAEVRVDVNENVNPGQPMILLTSRGRPEVRVSVPEVLISQVRPGSAVSVTFDAVAGTVLPARVTEVGVAATGLATTFPVTVRLDGDAERVRPGMAAEVTFRFETAGAAERLIVPATAVAEDQHGRYVYTLDLEGEGLGRARRVAVTVGELTSEGMEILTGLVEGDLVVTAGVSRIADGQRVRLL